MALVVTSLIFRRISLINLSLKAGTFTLRLGRIRRGTASSCLSQAALNNPFGNFGSFLVNMFAVFATAIYLLVKLVNFKIRKRQKRRTQVFVLGTFYFGLGSLTIVQK
jgi:large-conductance mechanosensitive channel